MKLQQLRKWCKKHKGKIILAIAIIFSFVFLAVGFVLSGSDIAIYNFTQELTANTGIKIDAVLKDTFNGFFRIVDEINIFRINKDFFDGELPVYNLQFSQNDVKHFQDLVEKSLDLGYLRADDNNWRKAQLDFDGRGYDVKVKLHGDTDVHWLYDLKSYKVKFVDKSVNNIKRFNLILFEDRHLTGKISTLLAEDLGLFKIRDDVAVVKINGVVQGLYYLEEALDEDFFENNRCSNCVLLQTTDNFIEDHPDGGGMDPDLNGITDGPQHGTDFDDEIGNIDFATDDYFFGQETLYVLDRVYELVEQGKTEKLKEYFDLEQLARFQAFMMMTGSIHLANGDNLRLAYSPVSGKFYPIPRNEALYSLRLINGGLDNLFNNKNVPMLKMLVEDDEIRQLRNKIAYDYISNNKIAEEIDILYKKYHPYALSYRTNQLSRKYTKYRFKKDRYALLNNMEMLKKNLEYAKSYVDIVTEGSKVKIEIIPDSIATIKVAKMELVLDKHYKGKVTFVQEGQNNLRIFNVDSSIIELSEMMQAMRFSAGLDEALNPVKRIYNLTLIFEQPVRLSRANVSFVNDITGQALADDDVYYQIADGGSFYADSHKKSGTNFKIKHPQLRWREEAGNLILQKGSYVIDKDLIIPEYDNLIIEPGTTVRIAEGIGVLSYSPLKIEAAAQPVVVRALDENKPFGSFGVVSNYGKSEIDGLDLSGGKEMVINGIYLSGGLAVYNHDLELKNAKIHNNNADDGLIVKYSHVKIYDNQFFNNFADQFDCDFCTGIVMDNEFREVRGDSNGDGLDFSGSTIIVKDNIFRRFTDKGLSIGEDTKAILLRNDFENNNNGIAIKDSSQVFLLRNTFSNNNVSINAYQKKQLFDGGYGYLFENTFVDNTEKLKSDKRSKFYQINFVDDDETHLLNFLSTEQLSKSLAIMDRYVQWKSEEVS